MPGRTAEILKGVILLEPPVDVSGRHALCPPTGCWAHRSKPMPDGYRRVKLNGKRRCRACRRERGV